MTQERADLNWYNKPPDYFSVRDGKERTRAPGQTQEALTAQQVRAGPDHDTEAGEFTFDDFIDIINPLHHLPLISSVYRAVTDDQISAHARIIGGGIFGGGSGFVAAIANAIAEEISGRDIGDNLVAAVFGEDESGPETIAAKPGAAKPSAALPGPKSETAQQAAIPVGEESPGPVTDGAMPISGALPGPVEDSSTRDTASEPESSPASGGQAALEGQAALAALFSDLRGGAKSATQGPPPAAVVIPAMARENTDLRALPTPASAPPQAPKAPPAPGRITLDPALFVAQNESPAGSGGKHEPEHVFTNQMLLGLQKYEEMMSRRQVSQAGVLTVATRSR